MSRGIGRLGYGSAGGEPLTPEQLNDAIPYMQTYIEASAFTPDAISPATFTPASQIGAGQGDTEDVWTFGNIATSIIYARWSFAKLPIDLNDPQFRLYPEWKQNAVVATPDPAENIVTQYGIGQNRDESSSVYTIATTTGTSRAKAEYVSQSLGTGGGLASIAINTISGDGLPLSGDFKNNVRFLVSRTPLDAGDTFEENMQFVGLAVQFKTDFAIKGQWL